MRLKSFTTGLMIFGLALLLGIPFVMVRKPAADAPKRDLAVYAALFGTYIMAIFIVAMTAIVCAMIVLRQTTKNLKEEAEQNMKAFVEGSLSDHEEADFSMKDQRDAADGFPDDLPVDPGAWTDDKDAPTS